MDGYATAMTSFGQTLGESLPLLQQDDLLIITAHHGCDPGYIRTIDNTREYVLFLAAGLQVKGRNPPWHCVWVWLYRCNRMPLFLVGGGSSHR